MIYKYKQKKKTQPVEAPHAPLEELCDAMIAARGAAEAKSELAKKAVRIAEAAISAESASWLSYLHAITAYEDAVLEQRKIDRADELAKLNGE